MIWEVKIREFSQHLSSLSKLTRKAYLADVKMWLELLDKKEFNEENLRNIIVVVVKNFDKRTLSRKLSSLRKFLLFLGRDDLLKIKRIFPKVKYSEKKPIFENQNVLLEFFSKLPQETPIDFRNYCLMYTLITTGIRVSELVNLPYFQKCPNRLVITSKGNKDRIVFFGAKTRKVIDQYLSKSRIKLETIKSPLLLFLSDEGLKINVRTIGKIVKKTGERVGLRSDFHPHAFRHSFATVLLDNGMDLRLIQELMGHKNLSTTSKYTHVSLSKIRKELEEKHPLNKTI